MLPIYGISIILLFIATVCQCTRSSSQSPKNIKIRRNGSTSSVSSNVDPLMLGGHALGPSDEKPGPTRILLFDRAKNKWVYLPQSPEKWNANGELKMIIHGFNPLTLLSGIPALRAHHILILGREYVRKNSSINVIIVDWMSLATKTLNKYSQAAKSTRLVASYLSDKLIMWKEDGLIPRWKAVHIIGFSLGAHVAGMIGFQIWDRSGKKIGRITGLDPAGPRFSDNGLWPEDRTEFLDYTVAKFVDIVHCNMGTGGETVSGLQGTFGSSVKAGHVDFYPNGGVRQQYTCDKNMDKLACSHLFCVMLMAAGVRSVTQFPMCPCSSWKTFLSGSCDCFDGGSSEAICVGDEAITEGGPKFHGYYGVVTTKLSPGYFRKTIEDDIELF